MSTKYPLIAGLSFNSNVGKDYFGRSQHFCITPGRNPMLVDKPVPCSPSLYVKTLTPNQPAWLLFDKEALVFDAYYQQTLEEMRYGPALIRCVKIFFYLEDATMKVIEPKTLNSSLLQGTIVSRQKVPLPKLQNRYFDVIHLNVGNEVNIFGRVYLIVDCDKFTRTYLNRLGICVPDPIDVPQLKCLKQFKGVPKQVVHVKSEKQFLEFDKKVLKFQGYWDDRDSQYGKLYHLEIFYYLADDTIEIKQHLGKEDSTDVKAIFLRRCSLPKEMRHALMSPDAIHPEPTDCFSPSDLIIGAPLNVFGRMVIITDCDDFTKEYYRVKYGLDNFEPVLPPQPLKAPIPPKTPVKLPPWNGHGTYEDSAGNCKSITPKMPRRSFMKFFEKDKIGFDSYIMRFCARLISKIPENDIKKFIISCFLVDDSMSVYEKGDRQASYPGGMFFKRSKVLLPGQDLYVSEPPKNYVASDLWLGNTIIINHHCFLLIDADDYTLQYMELRPDEFPNANIKLIMEKIKNFLLSKENLYKDFVANNLPFTNSENPHLMSKSCFEKALKEILCHVLCEHEFVTVVRYFTVPEEIPKPKRSMIRALVYEEIVRNLWQNLDRLNEHLVYLDEYETGELSPKDMLQALYAVRLPLKTDLLHEMLSCIKKNENGDYCYSDLLDFLNFKLKPPPHFTYHPAKSAKHIQQKKPVFEAELGKDFCLNWDHFLKTLNLEHILKENP